MKRYGYNEYMAHHYAYMVKMAEVCEPESYVEATKDTNWRAYGGRDVHTNRE